MADVVDILPPGRIVQFLQTGDVFMARGQRHVIETASRDGAAREVHIYGRREDGELFEATFDFGEKLDIVDRVRL
jgi:hypothetical protein